MQWASPVNGEMNRFGNDTMKSTGQMEQIFNDNRLDLVTLREFCERSDELIKAYETDSRL